MIIQAAEEAKFSIIWITLCSNYHVVPIFLIRLWLIECPGAKYFIVNQAILVKYVNR